MIEQVRKRDGRIVTFDRTKIEQAITKAFIATETKVDNDKIRSIVDRVIEHIEADFKGTIPQVENIQDIVEKQIAEHGLFEVSKAYIIYRYEHKKIREEKKAEIIEKIEKKKFKIKKRDGSFEDFNLSEIEETLDLYTSSNLSKSDKEEILEEVKNSIFENITTKEILKTIIMSFNARIERDIDFSYYSAECLLNDLYKEIIGVDRYDKNFNKLYKSNFKKQIQVGIAEKRLDEKLSNFDFTQLSEAIDPERDKLFNYMGIETLYERYFTKDYNQNILELPQYFWMRVSMGLSLLEKDKNKTAIEFYGKMSNFLYIPSTPTLFHSGTVHPQMSSCYITTVEDDLSHIFKCIGDDAQLSKWSGGLGNDWTNIRGTGALIKSTNVPSQGVIPFLKIVDSTTAAINRSGKRRGACCVYLEAWHYDIEDFIELRKNTGDERRRTPDTDIAVWIPDLFMKRVKNGEWWTLFSPNETPELHHIYGSAFEKKYLEYEKKSEKGEIQLYKKVEASVLWKKMLTQLYETGHPWITFKDPCNVRSPQDHVGTVHSSNLCTEITLNTSKEETAVCNLGSINIPKHVKEDGTLNKELLEETVKTAIRMLDNVIDINFYPTPEAKNSNEKHRPIGLGIMGLQDAFYKMNLQFDSDTAVELTDEIMEFISYHAILNSSQIAKEKGVYETYKGSKWERGLLPIDTIDLLEKERGLKINVSRTTRLDWNKVRESIKKYGMRNSNCMAIAPTATISTIVDSYPSIEPIYKNLYVKSNQTGEFTVMNRYLISDLKKEHLWDKSMVDKLKYYDGNIQNITEITSKIKEIYKEAFEIDPIWVLKHAAVRSKWLDQSQSLNIFTNTQSGKVLSEIYMTAWEMGIKTTYYLRTLGASAVEKSTIDINKKYKEETPEEQPIPSITEEVEDTLTVPLCKIEDPDCESCQ